MQITNSVVCGASKGCIYKQIKPPLVGEHYFSCSCPVRGLWVLITRQSRPNEARLTCARALCWARVGGIPDLPSKIIISTAFKIATDRQGVFA